MHEIVDYSWLVSRDAAAWLERVTDDERPELQVLESLRRDLGAERARLIVEQVGLRRRATRKFGAAAARMFFTRVQLEQATDLAIARYKAGRFAEAGRRGEILDFCCGIGGDLIALAERAPSTGWDLSPIACLLAEANLDAMAVDRGRAATVRCGDVEQVAPSGEGAWHFDPDRRGGGRRTTEVTRYSPGPAAVDCWRRAQAKGAIKLAPAARAPIEWEREGELEWISREGECRQLVAWLGGLAGAAGLRRATVVGGAVDEAAEPGALGTFVGLPDVACGVSVEPRRYLYDPDPALLAAALLGAVATNRGLERLGAGGAYLTGDVQVEDPLLAGFVVDDCLPLRIDAIAKNLATRGVAALEIKKRGVATNPNTLRKRLKLRGSEPAVLVLTRIGRREIAIVGRRLGRV